MSVEFRQELIASTRNPEAYRASIDAIDETAVGMRGRLAHIAMYPLKGALPFSPYGAKISSTGLTSLDGRVSDRMATPVVFGQDTHPELGPYDCKRLSQKDTPHLSRVHVAYDGQGKMTLSAPSTSVGDIDFEPEELGPQDGTRVRVLFEGSSPYILEGTMLNSSISERLDGMMRELGEERTVDIVVPHLDFQRPSDTRDTASPEHQTLMSDGAKLHLTNQASLDWLNAGLQSAEGPGFRTIQRLAFRPNFHVEGWSANAEDLARRAHIVTGEHGDVPLFSSNFTPRCKVPMRRLHDGEVVDKQPNNWLLNNRPLNPDSRPPKPTFGINIDNDVPVGDAIVQVGDAIVIAEEREQWR